MMLMFPDLDISSGRRSPGEPDSGTHLGVTEVYVRTAWVGEIAVAIKYYYSQLELETGART